MAENRFIVKGPKNDPPIPDESVAQFIIKYLKNKNKNEPITIHGHTKEIQICENLLEDVVKTIQLFKTLGLRKGDVVSIISENVTGYNVPLLAGWCLGVILNPLNPDYSLGELNHAMLISRPKVILCSSTVLQYVEKLKEEFEFIENIFLLGGTDCNSSGSFKHALSSIVAETSWPKAQVFDNSKTGCLVLLSSGTTGMPKGVLITHTNLRHFFNLYTHPSYGALRPEDSLLVVLPFFHIYGLFSYCGSMFTSTKTIILNKFIPDVYLSTIAEHKINKLHLVPTIVQFLAKSPLVGKYDLSSVEEIGCGGSALERETKIEMSKRFKHISFRLVYGATETTGLSNISVNASDDTQIVGKLSPEFEAKVSDPVSRNTLGPMEVGELCFKGPARMNRYYNIATNSNIIDEEGFYHSGDLGCYDEEGNFRIIGRIKEVIKYKGFQVSPIEIEGILMTHPAVKDCAVIGKPDERAGHVPMAYVVKETNVSEEELVQYVADRISINKRLHGGVRFIENIPKNQTGKILRYKLEETLRNQLSANNI